MQITATSILQSCDNNREAKIERLLPGFGRVFTAHDPLSVSLHWVPGSAWLRVVASPPNIRPHRKIVARWRVVFTRADELSALVGNSIRTPTTRRMEIELEIRAAAKRAKQEAIEARRREREELKAQAAAEARKKRREEWSLKRKERELAIDKWAKEICRRNAYYPCDCTVDLWWRYYYSSGLLCAVDEVGWTALISEGRVPPSYMGQPDRYTSNVTESSLFW